MNRASSLSSQPNTTATSSCSSTNQFRHTGLWNNIIHHLKQSLLDSSNSSSDPAASYSHRLRRQHSRFVTGGMLLIKGLTPHSTTCLDNLCFTGAQCVDIVYGFLTSKDQVTHFERQVTREKVTKVKN